MVGLRAGKGTQRIQHRALAALHHSPPTMPKQRLDTRHARAMAKRQRLGVHRRTDTPICSTDRLVAGHQLGTQTAEQRHGRELREDDQA